MTRHSSFFWTWPVLITMLLESVSVVQGQEATGDWTPPQAIVRLDDGQLAHSGIAVVADGYGHLHLFYPHAYPDSPANTMDYAFWDGSLWSHPTDVLIDPESDQLNSVAAAITPGQVIHLIWTGARNTLRHAWAPAADAGTPHGWSAPETIGTATGSPAIISDADGKLYVAYTDAGSLDRTVLITSTDRGASWSSPAPIAQVSRPGLVPVDIRLAIDDAGRLHAAWTEHELPGGWPPAEVFYARSADDGASWSQPLSVSGPRHGQIGIGTVGRDEVHLVWRSTVGLDGTYHMWSGDGGRTWAKPDRFEDGGGFSGLPSLAADSAGRTHFVIGPAWYAMWDGHGLSPYRDVATEQVRALQFKDYSIERAVLAITSGNRVHVVFEGGFQSLWHTSKLLDVPPAPTSISVPISTAPPVFTPTAPPVAAPLALAPTSTTVPPAPERSVPDQSPNNETPRVLLLSLLPAAVIVLGVVSARTLRKR